MERGGRERGSRDVIKERKTSELWMRVDQIMENERRGRDRAREEGVERCWVGNQMG